MNKHVSHLSLVASAAVLSTSCTAVIDPDGTMSKPQATTTTSTTTQDNPYIYGDRTTTKKTTTSYQ